MRILLSVIFFLALNEGLVSADSLTMTTYYPAPSGNYQNLTVVSNVGIGTTAPSVALDVTGAIRAGSDAAVTACGAGKANGEGSQRYNYTSHVMEYCNGTAWTSSSFAPTVTSYSIASGTLSLGVHRYCALTTVTAIVANACTLVGAPSASWNLTTLLENCEAKCLD